MTVKRRNGGRNKHGRGHVKFVRCDKCTRCVPKDKAIKRFKVKNPVDSGSLRDLKEACILEGYLLPKLYEKERLCVGCAIRLKEIRVRSRANRKNRDPPPLPFRARDQRPRGQAPRVGRVGGAAGGAGGGFGTGPPAPNTAGA